MRVRCYADKIDNGDGTFDLIGVEILAVGGPVHGIGSPPEGDFWSADELRAMADADAELGDEIKPPAKLGHSDNQRLAANTFGVTDGEMPAVGWLENVRMNDAADRLLTDIKRVPKVVADLVEKGAYRTRSTELSRVTSQTTGKVYDWVVTGLAWLGGKMPAVRTLDDVVALYEGAGAELRLVVSYAEGDLVWDPGQGLEARRAAVRAALNPGAALGEETRFWVRDITDGKALVEDWRQEGVAWVVPYTLGENGVTVPPVSEWIEAEQAWVESARELAADNSTPRSDTRAMPELALTEEQTRTLAEALGIDGDVTAESVLEAAKAKPAVEEPAKLEGDRGNEGAPATELEKRVAAAEAKAELANETLRLQGRREFVDEAFRTGKVAPAMKEKLETMYDADAEAARAFVADLPVNDDLLREYGSDEDGAGKDVDVDEKIYEAFSALRGEAEAA